eukprot:COSAG04_NODE_20148_length_399_cov_2.763333_1_plen_53_part_01
MALLCRFCCFCISARSAAPIMPACDTDQAQAPEHQQPVREKLWPYRVLEHRAE